MNQWDRAGPGPSCGCNPSRTDQRAEPRERSGRSLQGEWKTDILRMTVFCKQQSGRGHRLGEERRDWIVIIIRALWSSVKKVLLFLSSLNIEYLEWVRSNADLHAGVKLPSHITALQEASTVGQGVCTLALQPEDKKENGLNTWKTNVKTSPYENNQIIKRYVQ